MQNQTAITSWSCSLQADGSTTDCTVTGTTTYSVAQSTASTTVPFGDWLFINGIIIFFLAFAPMMSVIGLFGFGRRKKAKIPKNVLQSDN